MLKQVTPYQNLCCYVETRKPYGAAIYALSRMSRDKEEHVLNICKLFFYTLILVQFCIGLSLSPELQL